jgi:hypothetical protein
VVAAFDLGDKARLAPTARNAAQATIGAIQGTSDVFDRQRHQCKGVSNEN